MKFSIYMSIDFSPVHLPILCDDHVIGCNRTGMKVHYNKISIYKICTSIYLIIDRGRTLKTKK